VFLFCSQRDLVIADLSRTLGTTAHITCRRVLESRPLFSREQKGVCDPARSNKICYAKHVFWLYNILNGKWKLSRSAFAPADQEKTNQGFWQSMKTLIDLAWSAMSAGCSNWDASADSYLMLLV
jgi:hypothetical protein